MKAILKMLKKLSLGDVINNLTFTNQPGVTSRFCISMQGDKYNEGFEQILEVLKSEKEVELSELDTTRQLIVKSVQNHPYDKEKINEFWQDRDTTKSTIEMVPETTMERQYEYGERNVVVVDVLLGSNIESLANEIMKLHQYGQACITRFNSFAIDSRDYTSPDEIIHAYMQEYEKHRREMKKMQIKLIILL